MGLKTKLAMAVVTSAAGAAMIAGGTFALFTATASNSGNTFTAGTLTLQDLTGGPAYVSGVDQDFSNMAPGDHGDRTITIKNNGSLDAWVAVKDITNDGTGLFGGAHPLSLTFDHGEAAPVKVLAHGQTTITVHYNFPLEADNSYQSATGSATIDVEAVQARNNTNVDGSGAETGPSHW